MKDGISQGETSYENNTDLLKKRIETLEGEIIKLRNENKSLNEELADKDYEISYSIDESVVKRLEEENRSLKNLLEDYYKVTLKNWFEEAKRNVK